MMNKRIINNMLQLSAYVICYILLLEWLRPLPSLIKLNNMIIFIVFTGVLLVLSFLKLKVRWKIPIASVYILWSIHYLYYENEILWQMKWLLLLAQDVATSVRAVWDVNVVEIPFTIQTILLFLLLWAFIYLIYYWIMIKKRIFLYYFVSILYVTILDTFTQYNGESAIVRLVFLGFILLGLVTFKRIIEQNTIEIQMKHVKYWFISLFSIVIVSSSFGFFAPKLSSQWPDPVPFLKGFADKTEGSSSSGKKVGYGENDLNLGGDFEEDGTIVFTATTDNRQYWKVETKDMYTGSGWVKKAKNEAVLPFESHTDISLQGERLINEDSKIATAIVDVKRTYSHLPYPNPAVQTRIMISEEARAADVSFRYDQNSTKITSVNADGSRINMENYAMEYTVPTFEIDKLRQSEKLKENKFYKTFTQLPTDVPERIRNLAISLTKDESNQYDKVKAIERYFQYGDFIYSNEGIPYPKKNQDFVDQFLFETGRGYCVHFSTSMAVLLRSIGIPTRWVKGYTSGEYIDTMDGNPTYQITNNDAHAWVEVYFKGIGWVPFEPTKGYANYATFKTPILTQAADTKPTEKQNDTELLLKEQAESKDVIEKKEESMLQKKSDSEKKYGSPLIWGMIAFTFLLCCILGFLSRKKWLPYLWFIYFRREPTEATFEKAYFVLVNQLKRCGVKRKQGVTLRDFAREVDDTYVIHDMSNLTAIYEGYVYGGKDSIQCWKDSHALWEKVMKSTMGRTNSKHPLSMKLDQ